MHNKNTIATRTQALHIANQLKVYGHNPTEYLICAQWIAETAAEEFRKAGICYVDAVGNLYLARRPKLLIDIRGRRPEAKIRPAPGRIVEAGGLKVCHLLLTKPDMLEQPLRVIAEQAGVALGTAHIVMRELVAARLVLLGPGNKRRFGNVEEMIDAFVRGYANKLRPACFIKRYRHKKTHPADILEDFKKRLAGTNARWALTGGIAGNQMTHFIAPNTITVFADRQAAQLLQEGPMLPDRNGNVTLLDFFADTAIAGFTDVAAPMATPLLIYAELLDEGGPREAEAAEMILEKYIMPGVGLERRPI
ncbi:MAG: hypothetical protein HYZ75_06905 [Elusimicrobia bacterium]|nr:hypothetical protein [Elusimicrobiota bacterium]